jgi:hypothetical protein
VVHASCGNLMPTLGMLLSAREETQSWYLLAVVCMAGRCVQLSQGGAPCSARGACSSVRLSQLRRYSDTVCFWSACGAGRTPCAVLCSARWEVEGLSDGQLSINYLETETLPRHCRVVCSSMAYILWRKMDALITLILLWRHNF